MTLGVHPAYGQTSDTRHCCTTMSDNISGFSQCQQSCETVYVGELTPIIAHYCIALPFLSGSKKTTVAVVSWYSFLPQVNVSRIEGVDREKKAQELPCYFTSRSVCFPDCDLDLSLSFRFRLIFSIGYLNQTNEVVLFLLSELSLVLLQE